MRGEINAGTRSLRPGFPMWRSVHPLLSYVCSAAVASAFYVAWQLAALSRGDSPGHATSLKFRFWFAVFFCVFGGFMPALGLMAPLWLLAIRGYRRVKLPGWIYYPVTGAFVTLVIGSAAASLAPKPLFIEDQTFYEGVIIAVERQGVCMMLAGSLFGLTFWFLSGRRRPAAPTAYTVPASSGE